MDSVAVYRALLRTARRWPQYGYREYALRRIKTEWRRGEKTLDEARDTLSMMQRQVAIAHLYPPENPLVVEMVAKQGRNRT